MLFNVQYGCMAQTMAFSHLQYPDMSISTALSSSWVVKEILSGSVVLGIK